ncbi:MAG: hypothetical protein GX590_00700 [Lentisphaerae bacterium]|nr:hypothetical protein [Lentisphaerota bacterium]
MMLALRRNVSIAALLVLGWQAPAAVKIWQTPSAGRWDDPAHWLGGLPAAGDDVVITNAGAEVLVTAATPALNSLTLSRRLVCSNWTTRIEARMVSIGTGGAITLPPAFTESQMSNRVWIVCSNLTIEAGGKIDAAGKGYAGGGWHHRIERFRAGRRTRRNVGAWRGRRLRRTRRLGGVCNRSLDAAGWRDLWLRC